MRTAVGRFCIDGLIIWSFSGTASGQKREGATQRSLGCSGLWRQARPEAHSSGDALDAAVHTATAHIAGSTNLHTQLMAMHCCRPCVGAGVRHAPAHSDIMCLLRMKTVIPACFWVPSRSPGARGNAISKG